MTVQEFIEKCTNETLEVVIFDEDAYEYLHTGDISEVDIDLCGDLLVREWEFTFDKLEITV